MSGNARGAQKAAAVRIGVTVAEYDARRAAGQKWCHPCRRWHPVKAFGLDRSRGDGRAAVCLGSRVTTVDQPGARERRLAERKGLRWCSDCTAWLPLDEVSQGRCREHHAAVGRAYYALHASTISAMHSARKRGLAPIPAWWRADRFDEFGGLCAYGCTRPATGLDHIWPVARGGESVLTNLAPACTTCNSRKSDQDPWPWVNQGFQAFPEQWMDTAALAAEHGTDEWLWPPDALAELERDALAVAR